MEHGTCQIARIMSLSTDSLPSLLRGGDSCGSEGPKSVFQFGRGLFAASIAAASLMRSRWIKSNSFKTSQGVPGAALHFGQGTESGLIEMFSRRFLRASAIMSQMKTKDF